MVVLLRCPRSQRQPSPSHSTATERQSSKATRSEVAVAAVSRNREAKTSPSRIRTLFVGSRRRRRRCRCRCRCKPNSVVVSAAAPLVPTEYRVVNPPRASPVIRCDSIWFDLIWFWSDSIQFEVRRKYVFHQIFAMQRKRLQECWVPQSAEKSAAPAEKGFTCSTQLYTHNITISDTSYNNHKPGSFPTLNSSPRASPQRPSKFLIKWPR